MFGLNSVFCTVFPQNAAIGLHDLSEFAIAEKMQKLALLCFLVKRLLY